MSLLRRIHYERRLALAEQGWSLALLVLVDGILIAVLPPNERLGILVFLGEPLPAMLAGFLGARILLPDLTAQRLTFLLMRRSWFRIWAFRFFVLLVWLFLYLGLHGAMLYYLFSPSVTISLQYLFLSAGSAGLFFAASSSLIALFWRNLLIADFWTLSIGMASVMFIISIQKKWMLEAFYTFPVWFVYRQSVFLPETWNILQISMRVREQFFTLNLVSLLCLLLHFWVFQNLRRQGV